MMNVLKQARAAFSLLKPDQVQSRAQRPVHIGLVAVDDAGYAELARFLIPEETGQEHRATVSRMIHLAADPDVPGTVDLVLYQQGVERPDGAYTHYPEDPRATVSEILKDHDELDLSLACQFPVFRQAVVERIIHGVSWENALFAFATALPDIVPSLIELPWALGEFASDMTFLTANQVRMAFVIAAACGKPVGLAHQKAEMLTIAASAFGWRAIARELAGKIPLGGGLIPKAAIAYAGTFAIGKGLEHYHHANRPYTRDEQKAVYREGLEHGRTAAATIGAGQPRG
jgi:uncharacterized protein (DUF697 family)